MLARRKSRANGRDRPDKAQWNSWPVLLAGILLVATATTAMNWMKLVSLRSTWPADLAFFENAAFNLTQGRLITYVQPVAWFDGSELDGPAVFRHTHFSPAWMLIAATVYRIAPGTLTLFLFQSVILAAGCIPLYLVVREHTGSVVAAQVAGWSYLLHPAILHLAFNDFRPVALGITPALFALWFHHRRRLGPFIAAAVATLACRQEWVFLVAAIGVMNLFLPKPRRWEWRWALLPVAVAAGWAVLTDLYFLAAFGRHWPVLAGSVRSGQGVEIAQDLAHRLAVLFRIALLPGILGLLAPGVFVVAMPFVAAASSVRWPAFPHHDLQHLSQAFVVLFWAFAAVVVHWWPWLAARRSRLRVTVAACTVAVVASFAQFAAAATWTYLLRGVPRYPGLERIERETPAAATVLVPQRAMALFGRHWRLLAVERIPATSPVPLQPAVEQAAISTLVATCDLVVLEHRGAWFAKRLAESGRYLPAESVDGFEVFRARPTLVDTPDADQALQSAFGWARLTPLQRRWSGLPPP